MSGTCLEKRGKKHSCSQCGKSGLKLIFDYCPFCGEEIVMRWDMDADTSLDGEPD